ncbi:DsbA family protein [Lactobacillus sp. DCY120]|uniref:DsbA family protein n=1 Tax=Bombilactobacillus apium TaxID=2675299 RepID=A0A850R1J8_9LACO|nr:DsbA family protein [Bombilactobacillus apium]NVY96803.1 DsbA family protein [Bombilactobacillus apium]
MWEVFVFVSPLENCCLTTEKIISDFAKHNGVNITLRFVTLSDLKTINTYCKTHQISADNLKLRNQLTQLSYQATRYIQAANFQGHQRARKLLFLFQETLAKRPEAFSPALIKRLAHQANLNYQSLEEDVHNPLVTKKIQADQQLVASVSVNQTPAVLINDYLQNETTPATLVNDCQTEKLQSFLEQMFRSRTSQSGDSPDLHILK